MTANASDGFEPKSSERTLSWRPPWRSTRLPRCLLSAAALGALALPLLGQGCWSFPAAGHKLRHQPRCDQVRTRRGSSEHSRRASLLLPAAGTVAAPASSSAAASKVEVPLDYCGGGFCAEFSLGGKHFKGVIDSGSPFLLVSSCQESKNRAKKGKCNSYCETWGCGSAFSGSPSGYADTDEVFTGGSAAVTWRKGDFQLANGDLGQVTYGVMLKVDPYGGRGGGGLIGLIRDKIERIRPTLLGQTQYRSVGVDLRTPGKERLILSKDVQAAEISSGSAPFVPLADLRPNGAPVRYYAAEVAGLRFGDQDMRWSGQMYAVLDTGTTGLGLPPPLFERYDRTRWETAGRIGIRAAQSVQVELAAENGQRVVLQMSQGRQQGYGGDAFDIVTPLPEPAGINADAAALFSGGGLEGAQRMTLMGPGGSIAVPPSLDLEREGPGWAQSDRTLSTGERFVVRLVPVPGAAQGPAGEAAVAIGLAPRGERLQLAACASGALAGGAARGPLYALKVGDEIECGLTDDGSVFWRINGGAATAPLQVQTRRQIYPTVEAGPGCAVQLVAQPGTGTSAEEQPRWGEVPNAPGQSVGPTSTSAQRPLVLFLGLGFLLGRFLSFDTVGQRALVL